MRSLKTIRDFPLRLAIKFQVLYTSYEASDSSDTHTAHCLDSASFLFCKWAELLSSSGPLHVSLSEAHFLSPSLMWLRLQCHFHRAASAYRNTICIFFIELWQTKEDNRRGFHRPFMTVISFTWSVWRWEGVAYLLTCDCLDIHLPLRDCRNHVH